MPKLRIHILFQDSGMQKEADDFLKAFYVVSSELISFVPDDIKTKELFFQIELALSKNPFDFLLIEFSDRLEMFDEMKRRIAIDFDVDKINYSRKNFAKDPFLRAVGKSRNRVLDISAGLGIDAVFLAQNGHQVVSLERNPLLFILLQRAARRSQQLLTFKLEFVFSDAIKYLENNVRPNDYDCIYFDPMFPGKTKTALPKQEMVLFRKLVGNDEDAESVLHAALATKTRVVVKRPIKAAPILEKTSNSFDSKLIRYDIYEGK